ncbi:TlpA disulfide reductase family protein [Hymenobacter koreensis]|uniref:Thioredoxin domain-containing protein n=1 Tax=Hymenobacter koreensis TaxID=1084523 RepID=A0ABP8JPE7_9BACT
MVKLAKECLSTLMFVLLACWCNAQGKALPTVLIGSGDDIFFSYLNDYNDRVRFLMERDSATNTTPPVTLYLTEPTLLEFNANFRQYRVYAAPGDTIHVIANRKSNLYYHFAGRKQKQVAFFNDLEAAGLGLGYPDVVSLKFNPTRYTSYEGNLRGNREKRLAILHNYQALGYLDPSFFAFALSLIHQQYVFALLYPYYDTPAIKQYPAAYVTMIHQSPVRSLVQENQFLNTSQHYRNVVRGYNNFLSRNATGTPMAFATLYRNALDSLRGPARDYELFSLLKDNINGGLDDYRGVYTGFRTACTSRSYVAYIDSLVGRHQGLVTLPKLLNTQLEDPSGAALTWQKILAKNKGKVLYIDLWASWCGPCLAQVPASHKLMQALADKPVAFIYLSVDADKQKWRKALQSTGIDAPGSQQYLLNAESDLAKYLNAPPIPRYVLINQNGIPVGLDAPRPSDMNALKMVLNIVR